MISLLVGLVIVISLYYCLIKPHKYWTERGAKQTSPVFIAGDNWGTLTRTQFFVEFIYEVCNACPNTTYSGRYQFLIPTLVLKDPELIKQITVKDFDHFVDHRLVVPAIADPFMASNLFALRGQRWRDMRSTISPVFTSSKMKEMLVLMSECAEHFVNYFLNKKEDLITVEIKDIFTKFTNDVIATTACGITCDYLEEPSNEFYTMGKSITNFGLLKNFKFFGYMLLPKIIAVKYLIVIKELIQLINLFTIF